MGEVNITAGLFFLTVGSWLVVINRLVEWRGRRPELLGLLGVGAAGIIGVLTTLTLAAWWVVSVL